MYLFYNFEVVEMNVLFLENEKLYIGNQFFRGGEEN